MVLVIFVIGLLNFGFGYALAVYLEHQYAPKPVTVPQATPRPEEKKRTWDPSKIFEPKKQQKPIEEATAEDIPEEYLDLLEEEAIEAKSFVEASAQVLRLEVGKYREALVKIEYEIRKCAVNPDKEAVDHLRDSITELNADWLAKQNSAVEHLQNRNGNLGDFANMGGELEDILMDQAAQIETTVNNLEEMDFSKFLPAGCKRLIDEVCRLVDLAHILRDRMHDSLLVIMKADKRLESMDRKFQFDGVTGLHNRAGLEVIFLEWLREDISRERTVSVALIDIDHFAKINEKHGTRAGDRMLATFGPLLNDLLRHDRGNDVAVRFDGQTFALYFGDTGPRGATSVVERIRQTIGATTFNSAEGEIDLNVSCGVVEVGKKEVVPELFKRAAKTLRAAKRGGRNRTCLDEGEGPTDVDPPQFKVKSRVVQVHDYGQEEEQPA